MPLYAKHTEQQQRQAQQPAGHCFSEINLSNGSM